MLLPYSVPEQKISLAIQISAIFKMAAAIFKMVSFYALFACYFFNFTCHLELFFQSITEMVPNIQIKFYTAHAHNWPCFFEMTLFF